MLVLCSVACGEITLFYADTPDSPNEWGLDTFSQNAVASRDILWVIDNTGSMTEELTSLSLLFDTFIDQLQDPYQIAYQVGIITTDMDAPDRGQLQGIPWIITPGTPDAEDVFYKNIHAIPTTSQAIERGLAAILEALSDGALAPGGPNYGFLRDEAGLSIVVVSDADDQSDVPAGYEGDAVDYYAEAMIALKGGATPDRILFSGIVGPLEGCPGAGYGERYIEMAARLNGEVESICAKDFSSVVASVGADQIVLQNRFRLSRVPLEDTLLVQVNGDLVQSGVDWLYNSSQQAIIFFQTSTPAYQSVIQVTYQYQPGAPVEASRK